MSFVARSMRSSVSPNDGVGSPLPTDSQKESMPDSSGGMASAKVDQRNPRSLSDRVRKGALSRNLCRWPRSMSECQAMMEPQAQQRGISVAFPGSTTLFVSADRTRLKQYCSSNLLPNAIKYNKERGTSFVDCREHPRNHSQRQGHGADCLRKRWRNYSSRSIVSDKGGRRAGRASAWW